MKLLVISGMPHYRDSAGSIYGWGPTAQELDHLASCFSTIHHLAVEHEESVPVSAARYTASNITTTLLPARGGDGLAKKLRLLATVPRYALAIVHALRQGPEVVHVRCPANLSMIALPFVRLLHRGPCWVKYAGNWKALDDALSYKLQRSWLRRFAGHWAVTVNGEWNDSPPHVFSFHNPSLTVKDLRMSGAVRTEDKPLIPFRLLFVGRIEGAKGVAVALDVAKLLMLDGLDCRLEIIGDGPERVKFLQKADEMGLSDRVEFHGWLSKDALFQSYRRAHVILLPSSASEGWPKVLSEGMAMGAVPIASGVSAIPQVLAQTEAGFAISSYDPAEYFKIVRDMVLNPDIWRNKSTMGRQAAWAFSYDAYLQAVQNLFAAVWQVKLECTN